MTRRRAPAREPSTLRRRSPLGEGGVKGKEGEGEGGERKLRIPPLAYVRRRGGPILAYRTLPTEGPGGCYPRDLSGMAGAHSRDNVCTVTKGGVKRRRLAGRQCKHLSDALDNSLLSAIVSR